MKGGVRLGKKLNLVEDLGKGLKINEDTWSGEKIEETNTPKDNETAKSNADESDNKEE